MKNMTIRAKTSGLRAGLTITGVLLERDTARLKEDLRQRGIPIPKNKDEMISRLAANLANSGVSVEVTIRG